MADLPGQEPWVVELELMQTLACRTPLQHGVAVAVANAL